jgi:hypothetical protein
MAIWYRNLKCSEESRTLECRKPGLIAQIAITGAALIKSNGEIKTKNISRSQRAAKSSFK